VTNSIGHFEKNVECMAAERHRRHFEDQRGPQYGDDDTAERFERGATRSGARFAARNFAQYTSYAELMRHHERLLYVEPAVSHRTVRIADVRGGSLIQSLVRFRFDSPLIATTLADVFSDLFLEHEERVGDGYEVVVTFNAVLTNEDGSSFSLFYGVDHRAENDSGAAPELKYGPTLIVRTPLDVNRLPTVFDAESLIRSHRQAFADSNARIYSLVNVVYLIYRYVSTDSATHFSLGGDDGNRRRQFGQDPPTNRGSGRRRRTSADAAASAVSSAETHQPPVQVAPARGRGRSSRGGGGGERGRGRGRGY